MSHDFLVPGMVSLNKLKFSSALEDAHMMESLKLLPCFIGSLEIRDPCWELRSDLCARL